MATALWSRRVPAFLIDGVVAIVLLWLLPGGWVLAWVYLLLRDGLWGGRSIGKRLLSLRVVRRAEGGSVGFATALKRNIVFVLPLINAAISAAVFEGVLLYFDEEGLRLGDRIAGTRVIRA